MLDSNPEIQDHHVPDSTEFQEFFLLEGCLLSSLDFLHPAFLSSSGIVASTLSLRMIFERWNPPALQICLTSSTSFDETTGIYWL